MNNTQPLLKVKGVIKRFGGFTALNGVDLEINSGERIGLIGPNGSGKSTMVNCIAGMLKPEEGTVSFQSNDVTSLKPHERVQIGIARSFQIPRPFKSMTVLENIKVVINFSRAGRADSVASHDLDQVAMDVLVGVGLGAKALELSASLTQVDMRKLELARAMAANPKLLIADEAMAGLSGTEVDEILQLLMSMKERGVAVLMIEHIMRAVMHFSDRLVVLVAGTKIADGDPQVVINNPDVVKAYLGE